MASEVVFSAGNRQLDGRRSSLTLEVLEYQICLKNWDDVKYRIKHEIIEESYILEPFKNADLLDDEENEYNN